MRGIISKLFLFALYFCRSEAVVDRYYPRYHFAPPYGWMNDPNGFCVFKDEYHLFYQYNPQSSQEPGIACWGHAKSQDLFHWEHLPIAMYPDQWYDKTGVFSGSALIEDDVMYLYYTGNVNHPDTAPNHTEYQALATSTDGVNVVKYEENPIIYAPNRQPDIRDPKVWKHRDRYYMVLGNSFDNGTHGRVLLYSSTDKITWDEVSIIQPNKELGYMWECPDLFELNGKFVLLFSPQGLKAQGDKYENLYQTGYIIGDLNYDDNSFSAVSGFKELDHGHDFYATQTILDNSGRRLLVAWFDMWGQVYPERDDGWTGQMTLIRELTLTPNNKLIQKPVSETLGVIKSVLYKGKAVGGDVFKLEDNSGLIAIETSLNDFSLLLESENRNSTVSISYDRRSGRVTLDRGGDDGVRRTKWRPTGKLHWNIYVDASSVELFCGEGEVTFSSRFFPGGPVQVKVGNGSVADELILSSIKRTLPKPEN